MSGRYFKVDGHPANEGWKLSDDEYRDFMTYSDFAAAENEMTRVWNEVKDRAYGTRYDELLKGQKAWLTKRRDRMATQIYNNAGSNGLPKRECYLRATQQRTQELRGALNKL